MAQRPQKLAMARQAMEKMARRNGISVEILRTCIQVAVVSGMTDPDPQVQAEWVRIPRAGEYPTPEEVIAYYSRLFE